MAGLSFSCGFMETEVTWTIQRMPCKGCYFISVLVWTGENDSNTLRVDAIRKRYAWTLSFRKRQINLVFKNIRSLREKAKVTAPPPPTPLFPRLQRISSSAGSMRQREDKVEHNPLPQYHREKLQELRIRLLRV